jgi:hypothetical protein
MEKTFDLIVKKVKSFSFVVSGITEAQSLRFLINSKIKITTQIKQHIKTSTLIKGGKFVINTLSAILLSNTAIVKSGLTTIGVVFSEMLKAESNITSSILINTNVQEQTKTATAIGIAKTRIIVNPIVGIFKKLYEIDELTFAELDDLTLAEVEYTPT